MEIVKSQKLKPLQLPVKLVTVSWRDLLVIGVPVILVTALAAWLAAKFIGPPPPDSIVMLAGPKESSYYRTAERYAKIIARSGVTLQVVETEGAQDNLRRLADRKIYADVGFVVGGVTEGIETAGLMLASLVDRMLVVLVPLVVIVIPAIRIVPPLYRWRVRSRIYRWYGALMALERDMLANPTPERVQDILKRLDEIRESVTNLRTPLAFADQLFVLREHINGVRNRLAGAH